MYFFILLFCKQIGRGLLEKVNQAWLSWPERSHFWPKAFCDLSPVTLLALEQVLVVNDLTGIKKGRRPNNTAVTKQALSSSSRGMHSLYLWGPWHWRPPPRCRMEWWRWPSWLQSTKAWTLASVLHWILLCPSSLMNKHVPLASEFFSAQAPSWICMHH